jgi:hypothetical protein
MYNKQHNSEPYGFDYGRIMRGKGGFLTAPRAEGEPGCNVVNIIYIWFIFGIIYNKAEAVSLLKQNSGLEGELPGGLGKLRHLVSLDFIHSSQTTNLVVNCSLHHAVLPRISQSPFFDRSNSKFTWELHQDDSP